MLFLGQQPKFSPSEAKDTAAPPTWAVAVSSSTSGTQGWGTVSAVPLELGKEQLESSTAEKPSSKAVQGCSQVGPMKFQGVPGFLLQRCHLQFQTSG